MTTTHLTAQDFVAKWRRVEIKERSAYQEHFIDLCHLIGHPTPAEDDPTGASFTFEAGADKQSGGHGWADVWKKGYFAFEYKGKHADLDKAYAQLQQYRESLQNPPLLVTCDLDRILIHTNFTNSVKKMYTLTLDDLLTPASFDTLRAVFFDPTSLKVAKTTEQVTKDAAIEFSKLADLLRKYGADPHAAAHFLIRILFCLFAEDIGLLEKDLIHRMVQAGRTRVSLVTEQLRQLFRAMKSGGYFGPVPILHFNGGLFDDDTALDLDSDSLDILARISAMDWSSIEPSIFGTLFERSLDPALRSQLGAQYTGRDDILLIVEPVLMAPLRRKWEQVKTEARALAEKRDAAKGRAKTKAHDELKGLLLGFADEIANIKVLDPACGSGNFLYLSLRLLLDLQKEVIVLAGQLGVGQFFPSVNPAQVMGIEVNDYAYELAQITIWIGYIQWLKDNGFGFPSEPILKPLKSIVQMDAIMNADGTEPDWPSATVIVGNPPFLGGGKIRSELGDKHTEALFKLYGDRLPNFSDLVCYWFEKARAMIEKGQIKRAGLLATQGIRGGANRKVLERIKQTGDIFWAQSDREWILDGATVHVSMIAFDDGTEKIYELDGKSTKKINADLTATVDLTVIDRLEENLGLCFMGPSAKAPFDIDSSTAYKLLTAPRNVNGRKNSDVVRPVASAIDLVQKPRDVWTIDFGLMDEHTAAQYELPFEYVKTNVLPIRKTRRDDYRGQWWQYARPRAEMREALKGKTRFIATPGVSKHRIFVWQPLEVLCNQGTLVFARDDDYFFGVVHSKTHELWARATGTQLREAESGFRYTPTSTFETFPFPWAPGKEPTQDSRVKAIATAAKELVELRDNWLKAEPGDKKRTLTNLYNKRPTWLANAHHKLDEAVFAAYGWPVDLSDDEILARLLALNLERSS